jgi:hypothetical protein
MKTFLTASLSTRCKGEYDGWGEATGKITLAEKTSTAATRGHYAC